MPAFAHSAAMTPPPAPDPTTQTSHDSVAVSPETSATVIVLGACSALGGGALGPGKPIASQLGLLPFASGRP